MRGTRETRGASQQSGMIRPSGDAASDVDALEIYADTNPPPDLHGGVGLAWTRLDATQKATKARELFQAIGNFGPLLPPNNDAWIAAVVVEMDRRAALVRWPRIANLFSGNHTAGCAWWNAFSDSAKTDLLVSFFRGVSRLWVTRETLFGSSDVQVVINQINTDCSVAPPPPLPPPPPPITGPTPAQIEATRVNVVVTSAVPSIALPPTYSVLLNGVQMSTGGGGFLERNLTPGNYTVLVSAGPRFMDSTQVVAVTLSNTRAISVALQPAPADVQLVITIPTGAPTEGVVATGLPGLDSSFRARGVPHGTYDVVVSAPNMEQRHQHITVEPGASMSVPIAMRWSAASITVVVSSTTAQPLAADTVVLLDGVAMVRSGANSFSVPDAPSGSHVIAVTSTGFVPAQQTLLTVGVAASASFALAALPPNCPQPPTVWSTERERTDWIAAHAACPPPNAYCPPLPTSFASESDRQDWINAHATCTAPPPWINPATPVVAAKSSRLGWILGGLALGGLGYWWMSKDEGTK